MKKIFIILILVVSVISCKKDSNTNSTSSNTNTKDEWCYRNEPCITQWPDHSCVPTSSLVEVKNGKDTIVKYKDEKDSLIIVNYDLIKKLIKRGEPPNWGGRPGMRTIKYKCGT